MTEATTSTRPSPALPLLFGGAIVLALLATGIAWWWPQAAAKTAAPLVLKSVVESLPGQTIKSYSLLVPHDGQLALDVSATDPGEFSAYLVRVEENLALKRNGGLDIVPAFSAERIRHYHREAPIKAGNYHLTLANFSPMGDRTGLTVGINAYLDP